jgi:Tfp pilus assembly protein PilP
VTRPSLAMLRALLVTAPAVLLATAPASAQVPQPPTGDDKVRGLLDQELEPPPGGYTYNAQGRRDPFVSLVKPVGPDTGAKTRKPGMEGFLIQEIALKGIVRTPGGGEDAGAQPGYIAMFQGTDGKSYFVRVGQRLFDGQIVAIDATTVTFRQEVADPLSPVKTREIRQSLYPSEEAKQ